MRPNLSLDALDAMVFGEDSRRRAFWRIARTGQCPDRVHPKRGFSLVERLGTLPGFEETAAIYRSKLWLLLRRQLLSPTELEGLKSQLLKSLELYQADREALGFARNDLIHLPFLREVSPVEFGDGLRRMAPPDSLDWLALLCTLYRLTINDLDLDFAVVLRNLIRDYYMRLFDSLEIGRFGLLGQKELQFLIEMRVLRGDPSAGPPEWAFEQARSHIKIADELAKQSLKRRRKSTKALVRKLPSEQKHLVFSIAIDAALFKWRTALAPIVFQSQDTEFLEQNRANLIAQSLEKIEARTREIFANWISEV